MFWTRVKCPYCGERIKKKAILCKHCHSTLNKNGKTEDPNEEGIAYLKNGFGKIDAECSVIRKMIEARTGFIFIKHQYSSDELLEATCRIESFVGKMRDDLEEWEALNKLTQQVKQHFNRKAEEVYQRLESIQLEIEHREPTWWENVKAVFRRIFEKLFSFFSFKMIAGKKSPKEIAA
jgi:hypothetical protein